MKLTNGLAVTFVLGLITAMPALAQSSSANAALPRYELVRSPPVYFMAYAAKETSPTSIPVSPRV